MTSTKYQRAIQFLESLNNIPGKNYLNYKAGKSRYDRSFYIDRVKYLLKLIGNPQDKSKYIHITGTAGKGSTTWAVHNVLKAAGYKVGSYYSPHTTTHIERIMVGNKYISPNTFANIVESLKKPITECTLHSPYGTPSYYEVSLVIAFIHFANIKCDWVVLEALLGGKYDATNIIKDTKFAVITNIDYDHQDVLGSTLKEIASDKMEIIKNKSIFITTEQRPALLKLFEKKCEKENAKFINLKYKEGDKNNIIAEEIGKILKIKQSVIEKSLLNIKLPCRFETIQEVPRIIVDGAHNRIKLRKTAEQIKSVKYKKLVLLFSMTAGKNTEESMREIVGLADHIIFTRAIEIPGNRKTVPLGNFQDIIKKLKIKAKVNYFLDPWQALSYAISETGVHDCLLITGSMYLSGKLREKWIDEEYILKNRKSF